MACEYGGWKMGFQGLAMLIRPFVIFVEDPAWAFVPTLVFLAVALIGFRAAKRRPGTLIPITVIGLLAPPVLWLVYTGWEFTVANMYPPGDPVIRVDLLLIAPVLFCGSLLGLFTLCRVVVHTVRGAPARNSGRAGEPARARRGSFSPK